MLFRILLLPALVTGPVFAEPPTESPDRITITVVDSRLPMTYRVESPTRTLRGRAAIERMAPANTTELLRRSPGVDVSQSGGGAGPTYVSIRGGDPNFTQFMLDGVKLSDPTNSRGGGVDLFMIPKAIIDSIDVLPGPASAVRGSDSLSGIVNIRTRRDRSTRVMGDLNQHGGTTVALATGSRISPQIDVGFTLGHDDMASNVENDKLRQDYLQGYVTAFPGDRSVLDLSLLHVDGKADSFPEDSGGDQLAVIRDPETRDFRNTVVGFNGEWDLGDQALVNLSASWVELEETTDYPGIAAGVLPAVPALDGSRDYRRYGSQLYLHAEPWPDLIVTLGGEYDHEHGTSSDRIDFGGVEVPANFDLERYVWSYFLETGYRVTPRLRIQAGLRHDMPDGFDDETTVRLSAAYTIAEQNLSWSATYAQGFKLPSMFAIGHSLVGNPQLKPEYSESLELGVTKRWPVPGLRLGLSLFSVDYRDLIDFDPELFTNVNRSLVESDGASLQLGWQAARTLSVDGYVTYADTDIVGSDQELRRRPVWKGGLGLEWMPAADWTWLTAAAYTGKFFDSSVPTGTVEMPAYWRLDSTLRWQYSEAVAATLSIKNLLDDDYQESVGFSNGGITALLGIAWVL